MRRNRQDPLMVMFAQLIIVSLIVLPILGLGSVALGNLELSGLFFGIWVLLVVAIGQSNEIRDFAREYGLLRRSKRKIERAYLTSLIERLEKPVGNWLNYVELPVQLDLSTLSSQLDAPAGEMSSNASRYSEQRGVSDSPSQESLPKLEDLSSISEAAQKYPRFVIIGEPGAGKTSLLEHLALTIAQQRLKNPRSNPFPISLNLSDWLDHSKPEDFVKSQMADYCDELELTFEDDIVLCLDGLNEMGVMRARKARLLRDWLASSKSPRRVIITCRAMDYGDLKLELPIIWLNPLKDNEIQLFVETYLKDKSEEFLSKIYIVSREAWGNRSLLHLARNPFLLTAMVWIYRASPFSALPSNTGELLQTLTARVWEREQGKKVEGKFSIEQMRKAFSRLAFEIIDRDIPLTLSREFAVDKLGNEELLTDGYGANIVVLPGEQVRFYHQLILEYFAALELEKTGLTDRLHRPKSYYGGQTTSKWDQVIIALSGITSDVDTFVNQVAHKDNLLALKCIASGAKVSVELRQEIIQRSFQNHDNFHISAALYILDEHRYPEIVPLLIKLIGEAAYYNRPANYSKAFDMLVTMGKDIMDSLVLALNDERSSVRGTVAYILRDIGDPKAVPSLIELLSL